VEDGTGGWVFILIQAGVVMDVIYFIPLVGSPCSVDPLTKDTPDTTVW
jgi:hypothetical protein